MQGRAQQGREGQGTAAAGQGRAQDLALRDTTTNKKGVRESVRLRIIEVQPPVQ